MFTSAAFISLAALLASAGGAFGEELELTSENPIEYDHARQELRAMGEARLTYRGTLLTANEIVYSQTDRLAKARGNVAATEATARAVGDSIQYDLPNRALSGENLRVGHPPFFGEARSVNASPELIELEGAVAYFGEPRPGALNLRARKITYHPNEVVEAERVTLHVGRVPVFYLPKITRRVNGGLVTEAHADAGYSRNLGGYVFLGTRTSVLPSFAIGPEIGYYGRRGLLLGPGANYGFFGDEHTMTGALRGGFISDRGELGTDRLDRPIDSDRYYFEWRHKQTVFDNIEITGAGDVWSDSEVTRDFRPGFFARQQFPDNFIEAVYLGENYLLSAFTRVSPNDFQIVPERLPEVRFDLPPQPIGGGILQQTQASAAALRENDPTGNNNRSDRLDWHYGLSRPIFATDWLTFTPKAAGRITHYQRAVDGRDTYTRLLGEIGADIEGNAFGIYEYRNELWGIDDIRHVIKPRVQYRYTPQADRGRRFIPQVDRRTFATQLEPIDLGQRRNIDELDEIHTLRYGIDNILQTRHPAYGSIDLLSLYIANDLRFSRRPGEEFVSDIHTQFAFTPVYWFRFDAINRLSPQEPEFSEISTGLTVTDARFWSLRFGTEYLRERVEEYSVQYSLRLNETYRVGAGIHYDAVQHRFSHQDYTLFQNLHDSWEIQYRVFLRAGAERESPAGFAISLSYLAF